MPRRRRFVLFAVRALVQGSGAAGCGRMSYTADNQPRHRAENHRDENCPGDGHARVTDAVRSKQAKATAKSEPRSTLSCGFHQRRLHVGLAGATP